MTYNRSLECPDLASWPIPQRQLWGELANSLEDAGVPFPQSEITAYESVKANPSGEPRCHPKSAQDHVMTLNGERPIHHSTGELRPCHESSHDSFPKLSASTSSPTPTPTPRPTARKRATP